MSRSSDRPQPVVVFGLAADRFRHGTLAIARSLGRLGVPVYLFGGERDAAAASRYVKAMLGRTAPGEDPRFVLTRLTRAADRLGERAILVPTDDAATVFADDHADALRRWFLLPSSPRGLARTLATKREAARIAEGAGLATPLTLPVETPAEAVAFAERTGYPVMAKAEEPWAAGGLRAVSMCRTRTELLATFAAFAEHGAGVLLQERIPGGARSVWMFNGYIDGRGRLAFGMTGQKLRQHPPDAGMATLAVARHHPAVAEAARALLEATGYRGIVDMDVAVDPRDGRPKLLDVNPRIGSSFRLFVDDAGLDVVRTMYLDLTGASFRVGTAREGRTWLVEHRDLEAAFVDHRRHQIDLRAWARSLTGVEETAWFARDDLRPFVGMAAELGRRSASRLARGLRRRPDATGFEPPIDRALGERANRPHDGSR